ncbi:unnamed protein product, partial [marine sediment metagenome]
DKVYYSGFANCNGTKPQEDGQTVDGSEFQRKGDCKWLTKDELSILSEMRANMP